MMKALGKKCPACGGSRLTRRPATGRLSTFPTALAYSCADCQQPLVYLFGVSVSIENRQSARKRLPPFFVVRINGMTGQYAQISNISAGGLCFRQHYNATPFTDPHLRVDLFNCNDGSSLDQLPAEIVATNEQLQEVNGLRSTTVNYSVKFTNMNRAQRKVLSNCLNLYGN